MKKAFHRKLPTISLEDQRMLTVKEVPDARSCWVHGQGSETIAELVYAFRSRPGRHALYIGADYRVFGETMFEIREAVKALHIAGVIITDLLHPEDTLLDAYNRAQVGLRWSGDRKKQKRNGAKGGKGKGRESAARRNAAVSDDIARRLCSLKELKWSVKAWVLGMAETTAIRHYK